MWTSQLQEIRSGNIKSLARCISLIENEVAGYEEFLSALPSGTTPVIGITGPPGAGKSTLVDALISLLVSKGKKVAVLCIDPSSPFNLGAVLGDRIRMNQWYNDPNVFIRSLATRGSLGGLHPKILEITDLIKVAGFDQVIVETVGVGQSEIEVAGLADATVVVMVPEAGDEVQTMKAGLMEIADIFVVNKADRPGADLFVKNLHLMDGRHLPVIKTIATQQKGIEELFTAINEQLNQHIFNDRHYWLLAEKAFKLIQAKRMKDIDKDGLLKQIKEQDDHFNLYQFIQRY
jgi:LAO/AO transport system kinase